MAKPPTPPMSFEWYLDGTKWLLAIGAGAIAFGVASLEKTGWRPAYAAFFVYALVLMFSGWAGVQYLFSSYYYASLREGGVAESDDDVKFYKENADTLFGITTWTFAIGMFLFSVFGGLYVFDTWTRQSHEKLEVQALAAGGADLALARKGDQAWILTRYGDGALRWRPLTTPK